MWQYVFLLLIRQRGKNVLASSGFLVAACALILLSATTQSTVVQGNQIISQNWRSNYDLIVLPPQAGLPPMQSVPGDLLQGYDGGISMQQYEQIKNLSGVQVAAPIAFVGYVQMPVPQLEFFPQTLTTGYYRFDLALTAFNGQRQITERSATITFYYLPNCNDSTSQEVDGFSHENIILVCGQSWQLWNDSPPVDPGTFLLAAIDPTAENQLVHLDKSITNGRMLTHDDTIHVDTHPYIGHALGCSVQAGQPIPPGCDIPNYDIPVLFHTQLPGQITLNGVFTRIAPGSVAPQTVIAKGGISYLMQFPQQVLFHGSIPLIQKDPQLFSTPSLTWDGQRWQSSSYDHGVDPASASLKFLYAPSGLTYRPTASPSGATDTSYTLVPIGTQKPEVAFRSLHPLHIAERHQPTQIVYPTAFYFVDPVGQFAGDTLSAQFSNPLNWLPENTYTSLPTVLRYDAQGHPLPPTNLLPTTNTAGFIIQPPLALTTLSAAIHLRGDYSISAIRVRVAGVEAANPASWKRIQQVAGLIRQSTRLPVLVTLGSSPRPTLVYVPGVKQGQVGATQPIAPLGWIEERWIALGASILYLAQLGVIRLLLLGAVLVVCAGYIVVSFSALVSAQRREFAILSALGWRPWQPTRIFLVQALLFAVGGGSIGMGIALLIIRLLEALPIWPIVVWTLPTMLVMAVLSSLYPLWQIWHIHPSEVLRVGSAISTTRNSRWQRWIVSLGSHLPAIAGMALRNLMRSRWRAIIAIGSLFLSAILLTIMVDGILTLRQTLQGTLLGDYVLLQTAIPQVAGVAFALLLTFLSVADLLLLQVRERQREIGLLQAIGWRSKMVQTLFLQEGVTLAVVGAMPGVLVALWVLLAQHTAQGTLSTFLIGCATVILMLGVAIIATIPAIRAINRLPVMEVLRAE